MQQARQQARHRQRCVIFNNDSDDQWMAREPTPAGYLATRTAPCIDTQVDTVFLCTTQDLGYYSHRSRIAQFFDRDHPGLPLSKEIMLVKRLAEQGTDILEASVDFVHRHGKEIFWSHRMNGMEDMVADFLLGDWKRDHPEWWIAPAEYGEKYAFGDHRYFYKVMDYGVREVRDYVLSIFEELIENYDIDGVECDYLRDPFLFKELFADPAQPATEEHCRAMLEFHQCIRAMLDAKSARIGRPLLLALRVPKWPDLSRFLGVDIETSLATGAVDLLIGSGGYTPFADSPLEFIRLAHKYDVPAYVCISQSAMGHRFKDRQDRALEAWRGAAMNLWHAGADGQYTFNLMPQGSEPSLALQVMREIGDPSALARKNMLFAVDSRRPLDGAGYLKSAIHLERLLPVELDAGGKPRQVNLYIGADLAAAAATGRLQSAELSVRYGGLATGDTLMLRQNGVLLEAATADLATGLLTYRPEPQICRQGSNALEFVLKAHDTTQPDSHPATVEGVELLVIQE